MNFERGPLDTYEIRWASGHIETIQAHQCILPQDDLLGGFFGGGPGTKKQEPRWMFHGEIDGRWRLLLTAPADDIRSVRNVSHTNDVPAGEKP